ncbi:MAG TPA: nicotinamide-nucleotide adenylyltransferase [Nitrososphaerales archaeon]|nr:nicotinamide-nucleotide adenylyltransferase [Nitrososphaerales archaeon]
MKQQESGIFIGRFQPFHLGHLSTVKFALEKVKHLYIVVGSSQKSHELKNPFTAGERILMIRNTLNTEKVDPSRYLIIPVPDATGHAVWTAFIDQVVPAYQVVFSSDRLTLQLYREKGVPTIEPPLLDRPQYSATEVRKRIIEGGKWKTLVPSSVVKIINPIIAKGRFDGLE